MANKPELGTSNLTPEETRKFFYMCAVLVQRFHECRYSNFSLEGPVGDEPTVMDTVVVLMSYSSLATNYFLVSISDHTDPQSYRDRMMGFETPESVEIYERYLAEEGVPFEPEIHELVFNETQTRADLIEKGWPMVFISFDRTKKKG